MVVVAVAGGTSAVGRNIVQALISQGKHEVIVLSRTFDAAKEKEIGARFVATNYQEVVVLTKILEDNNVYTIISTLAIMPSVAGALEQNLIRAANASHTTKRLVPSEFGFPQRDEDGVWFPSIPLNKASQRALAASSLEWTIVYNGYFMDYFAMPKLTSYLAPYVVLLDIPGNATAIPSDGNKPVAFTHTSDVGKFVAASIDLEKWDPLSFIIGNKMTLNEAVKLAEEAKGESTKFKVDYDDLDKLKRGEVTELPSQKSYYAVLPRELAQALNSTFGIWIDRGDLDFDEKTSLNTRLPQIKTIKLKNCSKRHGRTRGLLD